jgi:hypothetical protein
MRNGADKMPKKKLKTILTKVDCCYVENNRGLPVETLAQDLGAAVESVQAFIDQLNAAPPPKKKSRTLDLMTSKEKVNARKGIVVMSPAAAESADDNRSQNIKTGGSDKFKQSITKIFDE